MNFNYYTTVQDAWDAVYDDCKSANESIRFEQFILRDFEKGSVGDRFTKLFIEKAKSGVSVRLLLDIIGSFNILRSSRLKEMRSAGVQVRFISLQFGSLRDVLDWTPRRNHRKLAIIDSHIAYIGGVVFSDDVKDWNDFHARIEGGGRMFSKAFEIVWNDQKIKSISKLKSGLHNLPISLIGNEYGNNLLYSSIKKRIKKAKKEIRIVTPYFSPGLHLRKLLSQASKRGVKIEVVVPSRTDHFFAQLAHLSYIKFMKRKKIHFHAADKMNHGKIIKIDDWVTFGSSNFDRLSFFYNKELNVQTENPKIINDVVKQALDPFFANTIEFEKVSKLYYRNFFLRKFLTVVGIVMRPIV